MHRQQGQSVPGGRGYSTELAGRDRFKFFRLPVEGQGELPTPEGAWNSAIHFAATCPSADKLRFGESTGRGRPASMGRGVLQGSGRKPVRTKKSHHLPKLPKTSPAETTVYTDDGRSGRDVCVQTMYREGDTQTDPYSPDYYIPDGMPDPEILALQGLTWKKGLPAGREEVELIQRLRRRREREASIPKGNDDASLEARYKALYDLEELEWKDREAHVQQLQDRRMIRIASTLMEREAVRAEANRHRLDRVRQQHMHTLKDNLESLELQRMGDTRRAVDKCLSISKPTRPKLDIIKCYVKYGMKASPPVFGDESKAVAVRGIHTGYTQSLPALTYDIRPALLGVVQGAEEVDQARGARIERVPEKDFIVPVNEAIERLPTLYQRHEAERLVESLEYAYAKIQAGKKGEQADSTRVLDLYRATPKLQRPDTPVLELAGDADEDKEEACILLQRLLRGRAVQNDFFESKERCRGLIEELQAASNAKYAERNLQEAKEREKLLSMQEGMVQSVLDAAAGDVISDTLGYLMQELGRQRDVARLEALREEAERVRQTREALEVKRREEERVQRDREEVQYAAYVKATRTTISSFLLDVYSTSAEQTALQVALEEERNRQAALSSPKDSTDPLVREGIVCDMLDGFVLPAVVDRIALLDHEINKQAPPSAAYQGAWFASPPGAPNDDHAS